MCVCIKICVSNFRAAAYSLGCHDGAMINCRLYRTFQSLTVDRTETVDVNSLILRIASVSTVEDLYPVYTIQPIVKPVEQPAASCKQTFNRLYRVNGVLRAFNTRCEEEPCGHARSSRSVNSPLCTRVAYHKIRHWEDANGVVITYLSFVLFAADQPHCSTSAASQLS